MRTLKVLHCPFNFAGNPNNLANAERKIGLKSWEVTYQTSTFAYKCDEYAGGASFLEREINRWKLFFRALLFYDVIHFNAGHSIMPDWSIAESYPYPLLKKLHHFYIRLFTLKDLAIFKLFKKGIVVTYQGDDAREGEYSKKHFEITFANEVPSDYYSNSYEPYKKWKKSMFGKYADRIYSVNPDLLYVLPKKAEFIPYAQIFVDEWKPEYLKSINKRVLNIVHAPTDRAVKGTKYIIEAVERLKKQGHKFNFTLVENLPNAKAKEIYRTADILIDQLLAGWYGGLAVELMALGKPVIAYIRSEDLKFIPSGMKKDMPVINANPNTIYSVLKKFLTVDKYKLPEIGKKGRSYVERWHDPLKTARMLKQEYEKIVKR